MGTETAGLYLMNDKLCGSKKTVSQVGWTTLANSLK